MAARSPNRSATQWAELINKFNDSDERDTEFCQRLHLKLLTFRKRRYAENAKRKCATVAFVPVQVTAPPGTRSPIQLHVRDDLRIELAASTSMATVAQLVKALQHEG
jgi:hypothetical protein